MYDENRNLSGTQLKKLAILRQRNQCYVVRDGNLLYCLVHRIYTDNLKRCARAPKRNASHVH